MSSRKASPQKQDRKTDVVALSHYRAQLARGQRARRADELLTSENPEQTIAALPGDEFFYLLHEVGFPEATELLALGTAEQIQTVLDFSVWDHDQVAMDKADEWLAHLVEVPPEKLGLWVRGMDVELVALLVRRRARIHDLSLEEAPEEPAGTLWNTPDRLFALDVLGQPEQIRVTLRLLDGLYRYSPAMMRRLLVGIRAESDAELEDICFRWRSGRMADLGFVDYYDALEVYKEIDPASVRLDTDLPARGRVQPDAPKGDGYLRLPSAMVERLAAQTPFARAVAGLQSREEAAELHGALVALCNRVLSADRLAPSDEEAIRITLERVSSTLDLAVEFLARGDPEREVAAARTVSLIRLHRLGTSLVGKLGRLASALVRNNPFAGLRPAIRIYEPDDDETLASLTLLRPLFPRLLENPPAAGRRPFASLSDIALATHAVERAAAALELISGLGITPQQVTGEALERMAQEVGSPAHGPGLDPAHIDTGVLARTVLVLRMLGSDSSPLSALSNESIQMFKQRFNSEPHLGVAASLQALDILRAASPSGLLGPAASQVAARWMASLCPLMPVLGDYRPDSQQVRP